ncbi:twin-arginine translocation pathway signal protein [Thalassovita aquimarina]|uniref:Twin-arginine translocation pathway signal protein n=1 Tax=Thalassovita aquimarina TaxID=2785917 RepID=A0ABS5HKF2_9RHOB|nr:twin-arginine translocation pathway signal protein [Thalassovita aquimarina]MBR9649515.1 twin-arginine translocation pathway signal protein [Thalassovita aquimarina]
MKESDKKKAPSRRDFLKIATTTAPAAAALVATGGTAEAAVADPKTSGLQDTANTRAYYQSARF